MVSRVSGEVHGDKIDQAWLPARHHRGKTLVQQSQRVMDGVEASDLARPRCAEDRARSVDRDRQVAHRVTYYRFHLGLGLLVTVHEPIGAANISLREAARRAP